MSDNQFFMTNLINKQDNVIQWVFEKLFCQIISDQDLLVIPFEEISAKTFDNNYIHNVINGLTKRPTLIIQNYLENHFFKEKILFGKLKKKLHVQILLGDFDKFKNLQQAGHMIDTNCYQLAVVNNRLNMLQWMLESYPNTKLSKELLYYGAQFGYDKIYFYLRNQGLEPNISIYNRAVAGGSLNIVKDINQLIGISSKTIENAFKENNTEIILYLLDDAIDDGLHISPNIMTYPILNNNISLVKLLDAKNLINWHNELYYSAILSGSMEMIELLETKIPNIHSTRSLDTSSEKKGQKTLLLDDMIYEINGKKYFSHTMNYAIQSTSLDMVKYIYSKGYGITASNFITAIKQGTVEILEFLISCYDKQLPFYYQQYLSTYSYSRDKLAKTKILIESGLLSLVPPTILTIDDHRKETVHIQLVENYCHREDDIMMDLDYLLKYSLFFVPVSGFKLNYRLLARLKISLATNLTNDLISITKSNLNEVDKQFVIDSIFLFGTIDQIKMLDIDKPPSSQIIMELMCYNQISKMCYLLNHQLLDNDLVKLLCPLAVILDDRYLNSFFEKIGKFDFDIKFIIKSGNKDLIRQWFETNKEKLDDIPIGVWLDLLMIDDVDLVDEIGIPSRLLPELIIRTENEDLIVMRDYLSLKSNFNADKLLA